MNAAQLLLGLLEDVADGALLPKDIAAELSVRLGMSDAQIEHLRANLAREKAQEPESMPVIGDVWHIMNAGRTLCHMPGVPSEWPTDHRWIPMEAARQATCTKCLDQYKYGIIQAIEEPEAKEAT